MSSSGGLGFQRGCDRLAVGIWVGLVEISTVLLLASLLFPLSPLNALLLLTAISLLCSMSRKVRVDFKSQWGSISRQILALVLTIGLGLSTVMTQQITWYDSGHYHIGIARWLAKHGAVLGLGLINSHFGYTSSWFAFSAPLSAEILGDRVGAIANGFVLLISIFHLLILLTSVLSKQDRSSDWFAVVFYSTVLMAYCLGYFSGSPIVLSLSNDVPISFLVGVMAWTIMVLTDPLQKTDLTSGPSDLSVLIPLILGLGALNIKLTAIPLAISAILFYGFSSRTHSIVRQLATFISVVILIIGPRIAFDIAASGCLFYPFSNICIDAEWTIASGQKASGLFRLLGTDPDSISIDQLLNMIWARLRWLWTEGAETTRPIFVVSCVALVLCVFLFRLVQQDPLFRSWVWVVLIGGLGTFFITASIPLIRFGLGYYILIPTLILSILARYCTTQLMVNPRWDRILALPQEWGLKYITIGVSIVCLVFLTYGNINSRLWLPNSVPQALLIPRKLNDVEYVHPVQWTLLCWASELPCAPSPIKRYEIKLRDPELGMAGGFVQVR